MSPMSPAPCTPVGWNCGAEGRQAGGHARRSRLRTEAQRLLPSPHDFSSPSPGWSWESLPCCGYRGLVGLSLQPSPLTFSNYAPAAENLDTG